MRLLVIGIDRSIAEPSSAALARQKEYYAGWDVDIVLLSPGKAATHEAAPGLRVHVSGGSNKMVALFRGFRLARKIARHRMPHVVSAQDPLWSGLVAATTARRVCAALHLQDHSGFFGRAPFGFTECLLRPLSRALAHRARRIRTVSGRGAAGLKRIGVLEECIDIVPIATDLDRFAVTAAAPCAQHVLCVSRLEPEKGVRVLLDAWSIVAQEFPEAKLRIVGGGSLRTRLEEHVQRLGCAASIEFTGPQQDIVPHLAWSDVVVQPSLFEGWGLSVVEAAAAERAIVMSDVGCAGELIQDDVSGIIVPPGDQVALAKGIKRMLREPSRAVTLAQRAQAAVRHLPSQEATVDAIRASFEHTNGLRLLVVAQAVDLDDALFGFFVPWVQAAARQVEAIDVLALRVGRHDLPSNVCVRPLRPSSSRSRLRVVWSLLSHAWRERHRYDAVFVRGDVQYVVLAGWLWRLLGKRVILWYAHYSSRTVWLRPASWFASTVVTSVPEACTLTRAIPIGQAVDAKRFSPAEHLPNDRVRVRIFGRISPVKRIPWMIEQVASAGMPSVDLRIIGRATDAEESARVRAMAIKKGISWEDRDVMNADAPEIYRASDILLNATPGSLDKTIVEAALSGVVIIATTPAYGRDLPTDLQWLCAGSPEEFRSAFRRAVLMRQDERQKLGDALREWAIRHHSISGQLSRLLPILRVRRQPVTLKTRLKRLLLRSAWTRVPSSGVGVLMFHAFDGIGSASSDPDHLSLMLQVLRARGGEFHSLRELYDGSSWHLPRQGLHMLVTIDDATVDLASVIPVFGSLAIPFVVCAPGGITTLKTSDDVTRPILTAPQLQALPASGLAEFAAHGMSHRHLTELTDVELSDELDASGRFIDGLNPPGVPRTMAYPRGRVDDRVVRALETHGFVAGFTVVPGAWTEGVSPQRIPRFPIMRWMDGDDVLRILRNAGTL